MRKLSLANCQRKVISKMRQMENYAVTLVLILSQYFLLVLHKEFKSASHWKMAYKRKQYLCKNETSWARILNCYLTNRNPGAMGKCVTGSKRTWEWPFLNTFVENVEEYTILSYWIDYSLDNICDVIYQTQGRVFHQISNHWEMGWKNEAQPSFFLPTSKCLDIWWNFLMSVWYSFSKY